MYSDSLDKIVGSYFAVVTRQDFTYKGKVFAAKPLRVSPMIFRGYTCPSHCGGCCPRFSLVYLPNEPHPYEIKERTVDFDGRPVTVFEDAQTDHSSHFCRNLNMEDGRCNIHPLRPFSCDFELLRTSMQSETNHLNQRLYGRGWAFLTVLGDRGARCEMLEPSPESVSDTVRRLRRLFDWTEHFGLDTHLPTIIRWVESGPHTQPLLFDPRHGDLLDVGRSLGVESPR